MSELFNLEYFDNIFGERDDSYLELLDTLVETLKEFGSEYRAALFKRDAKDLSFARHRAVTLIENLQLDRLRSLCEESKPLVETGSVQDLELNAAALDATIEQIVAGLLAIKRTITG